MINNFFVFFLRLEKRVICFTVIGKEVQRFVLSIAKRVNMILGGLNWRVDKQILILTQRAEQRTTCWWPEWNLNSAQWIFSWAPQYHLSLLLPQIAMFCDVGWWLDRDSEGLGQTTIQPVVHNHLYFPGSLYLHEFVHWYNYYGKEVKLSVYSYYKITELSFTCALIVKNL